MVYFYGEISIGNPSYVTNELYQISLRFSFVFVHLKIIFISLINGLAFKKRVNFVTLHWTVNGTHT